MTRPHDGVDGRGGRVDGGRVARPDGRVRGDGGRDQDDAGREGRDESGGSRLSFRLPPFRLPAFFPPEFRLRFPVPGGAPARRVSARTVLVACIAFDLVDAVLALTIGAPLVGIVRSAGGLVLAAVVADVLGLVYGWELLVVLLGVPSATVVPSLTLLLFTHARGRR